MKFDADDYLLDHTCPKCGGRVFRQFSCHTYPRRGDDGKETWMSCLPCDSAVMYACDGVDDDSLSCGWYYTNGLNPRNPRAAANEEKRPDWMPSPDDDPWLKPLPTI